MTGSRFFSRARWSAGIGTLAVVSVLGASGDALSSGAAIPEDDPVTFTKDVAPILQVKCQACHKPDSIAPMSLLTYEDVRSWTEPIRKEITARRMPPWHLDKSVGIRHYKNDRSLTDEELATIVRWIDDGAPMGDPADMPPPREYPDPTEWQLAKEFGEPDLIVRSEPYTVVELGQDKWWRPTVDTGLTEARWVRAIEIKPSYPGGRKAVHHVMSYLIQDEDDIVGLARSVPAERRRGGTFMEWAIGKVGEVFPPSAGKLMLPGSKIRWEVHYYAFGAQVTDDVVEMGIYFYPREYVPKHRTILAMIGEGARESRLEIPPNQVSVIQHQEVLAAPARIENFQPHMHMRGKAQSLEAIYPDGRREVLSHVDNFQWNWHVNYIYDDDVAPLLPVGTTLLVTSWFDNTADNPSNPDPDQWVGYGDRTVDEMAHVWIDITYMEQEDFDAELDRRRMAADSEE